MTEVTIALVAVQNVAFHFDKLYSYVVPAELIESISAGSCVVVPFGKGSALRQGVVIELQKRESADGMKSVISLTESRPLFDERMIKLAFFMKERTFCTLFDALKTIYPGLTKATKDQTVKMVQTELSADVLEAAMADAELRNKQKPVISGVKITKKQYEALSVLTQLKTCSVKELCYYSSVTPAVVNTLEKKGLVFFYDKETYRQPYHEKSQNVDDVILTESQHNAFDNLLRQYKNGGGTSLLYGVTGSGKTQVYLRLIDEVIKDGKGVIVMVPEISLTPQTLMLFHRRYGEKVAVFHSALSDGERLDEWKRVKRGLAQIAVGTRSAVFAPFENLGLVIMDEEQEHTYKSEQSPRYHARDIAKYRCAENKALLLLASATPSFESFAAAKAGKYSLCVLKERFNHGGLPAVEVVDMLKERAEGNTGEISRKLLSALMENKDKGHQSILLLNRRGYNTFASCDSCGEVAMCPNCSISLTYHKANNKLMCHYCGYSVPFTTKCEFCGENAVHYLGFGTQRFEDELGSLMKDARILRMDADTTMQKYSYEEKLSAFRDGEYDIMVGTQMVAKGLDFENVTLVGVISADRQLYSDDYKSVETTFDLLTQVVGRAGRGRYPGKAIIQTIKPANDVIQLASNQNFEEFYNTEIMMRKIMIYPPFCNMCTISIQGVNEGKVAASAMNFSNCLKEAVSEKYADVKIIVLGPMPERVYKLNNKFRYRMIIKCINNKRFREMLSEVFMKFSGDKTNSGVSAIPDIS